MPVDDINFVKITETTLNVVKSSESITEHWAANPDIISMFIVISIIFGLLIFLVFLGSGMFSKILKKR